ncbi:MAG: endonuclease/exonuclease/phosphatase family protein [Polyangiaceae bacterium]|nr:endonuclease/exonuclease/phosphatase family protein [Polyangiaceae bacterium]
MLKILSWNIAHRSEPWRELLKSGVDIALLQEAKAPPPEVADQVRTDTHEWRIAATGLTCPWRAAVVALSQRAQIDFIEPRPLAEAPLRSLGVSRMGTLAAADVTDPDTGERITVVSMYAFWEEPRSDAKQPWIYADASAHRLISDLSMFIATKSTHRIIAAGDLNILRGYGEYGDAYWAGRYATVFDRMAAIGLDYVGPQEGRPAEPWPEELPKDSKNVPTYHTAQQGPAGATRQLDFVFASREIAPRVSVRALNSLEEWGPSDHCRISIEVNTR